MNVQVTSENDPFFSQQRQHAFTYVLPASRMNNKKPKPNRPVPPAPRTRGTIKLGIGSRTVPRNMLLKSHHAKSQSVAAIDIGPCQSRMRFKPSGQRIDQPDHAHAPAAPGSGRGFPPTHAPINASRSARSLSVMTKPKLPPPRRPDYPKGSRFNSLPRLRSTSHQVLPSSKHSSSQTTQDPPPPTTEKPKTKRKWSSKTLGRRHKSRSVAHSFGSLPGRLRKLHKKSAAASSSARVAANTGVGAGAGAKQHPPPPSRVDLRTLQERMKNHMPLESVSEHNNGASASVSAVSQSSNQTIAAPPYWEDESSDGDVSDEVCDFLLSIFVSVVFKYLSMYPDAKQHPSPRADLSDAPERIKNHTPWTLESVNEHNGASTSVRCQCCISIVKGEDYCTAILGR